MESGGDRERTYEREQITSSHDGVSREISSTESRPFPLAASTRTEQKKDPQSSRSSVIAASQHRASSHSSHSSHSSSSSSGALDLQAAMGRSGSSVSGVTVPIRLDALSYLLNSAVMTSSRTPQPMMYYPNVYPMCPYPQMTCSPYGACMNPQVCSTQLPNPYSHFQPGFVNWGNQQVTPACQQPIPNSFNPSMNDMAQSQNKGLVSTFNPPSGYVINPAGIALNPVGMVFNSAGCSSTQDSNATAQSEANTWAKKPIERVSSTERFAGNGSFGNEKFGSSRSDSFSSTNEQRSSPRRGFGRFGDKNNEDGWSNRSQNGSRRGFGRGRGDFGCSSWQGSSRGQNNDWRSGDRSGNTDFSTQRRFSESPERFQNRDNFSKRGRWSSGRGRGEADRDSWQQRNRQQESGAPAWSNRTNTSDKLGVEQEAKMEMESAVNSTGEENWETDYSKDHATSGKPDAQSPAPSSPKSSHESATVSSHVLKPEVQLEKGLTFDPEKEEGETDSSSETPDATASEVRAARDQRPSASNPVISAEEQCQGTVTSTREEGEEVHSFVLSIDRAEEDKGILVEVGGESP